LVRKLTHDCEGGALLEFTMVFPIVMMVILGTVDVTYMLHEWNQASKAAYLGARQAVVSNPVIAGVVPTFDPAFISQDCYDWTTGAATGACPAPIDLSCTGNCDATLLTPILQKMQAAFPRVSRSNVAIRYQTNGLGYNAGNLTGALLPMNVTVSIVCMNHQMFFVGAWIGWALPAGGGCQPAGTVPMPTFSSTLPSEDLVTN
jgi:hypothetical protein